MVNYISRDNKKIIGTSIYVKSHLPCAKINNCSIVNDILETCTVNIQYNYSTINIKICKICLLMYKRLVSFIVRYKLLHCDLILLISEKNLTHLMIS